MRPASIVPASTGATATAAEGSITILIRSQTNRMASRIAASVTGRMRVTWRLMTAKLRSPIDVVAGRQQSSWGHPALNGTGFEQARASSALAGSAASTTVRGERPLTAIAVPASSPPPPTGQITTSSSSVCSSSSQAAVPWPAITFQSLYGCTRVNP